MLNKFQVASNLDPHQQKAGPQWFRFSLKTLLVLTALVAVYFGGRASMRPHWFAPRTGTWELIATTGYKLPVTLTTLPNGNFVLDTGRDSTLGGRYRWASGKLVVDSPNDRRYVGLVWQWDGDDLVLVGEPPGAPAGPSYLGTRLRFVSPHNSRATQEGLRPPDDDQNQTEKGSGNG